MGHLFLFLLTSVDNCKCWQVWQLLMWENNWQMLTHAESLAIEYTNHNMSVVVVGVVVVLVLVLVLLVLLVVVVVVLVLVLVLVVVLDSLLSGCKVDGDQGEESPTAYWQRLRPDCCVWSSTCRQPCASSTIASGACPTSCKCPSSSCPMQLQVSQRLQLRQLFQQQQQVSSQQLHHLPWQHLHLLGLLSQAGLHLFQSWHLPHLLLHLVEEACRHQLHLFQSWLHLPHLLLEHLLHQPALHLPHLLLEHLLHQPALHLPHLLLEHLLHQAVLHLPQPWLHLGLGRVPSRRQGHHHPSLRRRSCQTNCQSSCLTKLGVPHTFGRMMMRTSLQSKCRMHPGAISPVAFLDMCSYKLIPYMAPFEHEWGLKWSNAISPKFLESSRWKGAYFWGCLSTRHSSLCNIETKAHIYMCLWQI